MPNDPNDPRVAILVDCDNTSPDILEPAVRAAAQFGRVVLRRGYGNHQTLANKWQEALVSRAFTPCLQYQYASGKNTSDIALVLDAAEALFDQRADAFCLVTSDSDFTYLCRLLRERGATVCIVGERKTPLALRNACDQFFEWNPQANIPPKPPEETVAKTKAEASKAAQAKQRPRFVIEAVDALASATPEGMVTLSTLGAYLKRMDSEFSPGKYNHSGLLAMLKTYDLLSLRQADGGHYMVGLAKKPADSGDAE